MVDQKKPHVDAGNTSKKKESTRMPFPKKDAADARPSGANSGRSQNGNRSGFRTDTAISNSRTANDRVLKPWVPDGADEVDGSLEKSSSGAHWDQFAENERLFGLTSTYDENIYTTAIDKSHPQYKERVAAAERKAREIERTAPVTAHVAEERVMDFAGGEDGGDEEDKYSGVRRQDFPPLSNRENKYTPPAKRAPSGQATVVGAPVDPAIISSQLKAPAKKQTQAKADDAKAVSSTTPKPSATSKPDAPKSAEPKPEPSTAAEKPAAAAKPAAEAKASTPTDNKPAEKPATPLRASGVSTRNASPQVRDGAPAATSTVETVQLDVLKEFRSFASQQRINAEKARSNKAKQDKEVKLAELKNFANSFKLATPVPNDLIGIIAKDPVKQKEIQAKALQNAEDVAKAKADAAVKQPKDTAGKDAPKAPLETATTPAQADAKAPSRHQAQHPTPPSNIPNRHPAGRPPYATQYHTQQFRNDRPNQQHLPQQGRRELAQRLRNNVEQQKISQGPPQHNGPGDVRLPPTGPANAVDPSFARRLSGVPGHVGNKLNPHSNEFRPGAFAPAFNPSGHPSTSSSPRSAVNNPVDAHSQSNPTPVGQLIRRKTKAVDVKKCYILSHVKTFQPPPGRKWDENCGLRPAFDTPPTWRQLQDDEKADSTMHLTYKEYFERHQFGPISTPNPAQVMPHHQQLPFNLQPGAHPMAPRQSPHIPPMQMHTPQHMATPQMGFSTPDDHRMMHSNSAQSYASPRVAPVPAVYPPAVNSPAQVPYNTPVIQPFVGGNAPQMGPFRSYSNNSQYLPPQGPHMSSQLVMGPQFVGPQGMVGTAPPMPMYPPGQTYIHPGAATPPHAMPLSNGYPSPGRQAAQMMVHQGSQQGQPVYGMSPGMQYGQPAVYVPPQPAGQMGNHRGYGGPGPQHFGTSPQHMHHYGPQHRSGSNNYGNKNFPGHVQHHMAQPNHAIPSGPQGRASDGPDEGK